MKRRLGAKAKHVMKTRVRQITRRSRGRSLEQVASDLRSYLLGWKSYFRLVETPKILRRLDKWIRHRLRAIQLKHWKRAKTMYRELRKRGLSRAGAREVAGNSRRWWRNSGLKINIALPIKYFDQLGVPRLAS